MDDKKAIEKKKKRIATYFTHAPHTHTQINLENYYHISYDCDDVSYILYIIYYFLGLCNEMGSYEIT